MANVGKKLIKILNWSVLKPNFNLPIMFPKAFLLVHKKHSDVVNGEVLEKRSRHL